MATLSLSMGASTGLSARAIEAGQILVTTDTAQMYVDISDTSRLELNAKIAKQVANALTITVDGKAFKTFNGSSAQTVNIKGGENVTLTSSGNNITIAATNTEYTALPNPYALTWGSKSYTGASAQTITLADFGLTNVLHFLGTTTTAIIDGSTTKTISVNSSDVTAASGDIVMYNGSEFIWTGTAWEKLGDEALWVPNTRKVNAGTKLTGGGDLSADRTISHATITTTAPTNTSGLFVKNIITDGYGHITQWENADCSNLTLQIAGLSSTKVTYDPFSGTAATFNIPIMTAASTSADGATGLVPAPTKGAITRLLAADGSWKSITAGNGIGVSGISIYNKGVMDIAAGSTNGTISVTKGSSNTANGTATSVTVYTLPEATANVLGGTKGYTGLTLGSDGSVSLTKTNITSLLGAADRTTDGYLTFTDFTTFSLAAEAIEWGTF